MMKFKNLLEITVFLCIFTFASLSADGCKYCDSCEPCPPVYNMYDPYQGWSTKFDFICWNVRKSGLDYAVYNDGTGNKQIYEVDPEYEPGMRFALYKASGAWDMGLRYAWLNTSQRDSITFDTTVLVPTRGILSNATWKIAKSKYECDYRKFDIETGRIYQRGDRMMRPFAGFQYTSINQELETSYDTPGALNIYKYQVNEMNNMEAYGLYAGIEGQKNLWCNIGIYGSFTGGVSMADFGRSMVEGSIDKTGVVSFNYTAFSKASKDQWLFVPNLEFAAGLNYDFGEIYFIDLSLTIGYEFHHWYCLPGFLNFDDTQSQGHLARNRSSLGYDGLFVRLNAAF